MRPTEILHQHLARGHNVLLLAEDGPTIADDLARLGVKDTDAVEVRDARLLRQARLQLLNRALGCHLDRRRQLLDGARLAAVPHLQVQFFGSGHPEQMWHGMQHGGKEKM